MTEDDAEPAADATDGSHGLPNRPSGGHVEWRPWGDDAFEAAADADRPLLLSLTATWSSECAEMDEATYGEPRIAAAIDDGFVPVRADVDRHPRVAARYAMGGVPSTVFLTPGGEVLTGAGPLSPSGMRGAIDGVRQTWEEQGTSAGQVPRSLADQEPPGGELDAAIEAHMLEVLRENLDDRAGGWGSGAKFPLPRTVEFALKRDREPALRTLDAIGATLLDEHEGGFFRGAEHADWSGVRYEKLLDTNAALVRAFANAYRYTGDETYREPAERTVEYLTTTLWTGSARGEDASEHERRDGAFAASQAAGEGVDHYALDATDREGADSPPVDDTVLAGWNALAIDALLAYAAVTDDERARGFARRALSTLVDGLIEDGRVVHARAGGPTEGTVGERGLLLDHARTIRALVRARSVLGPDLGVGGETPNGPETDAGRGGGPGSGTDPIALARRLADHTVESLRPDRTFVDGPRSGPGLLDRPLRPLDGNVELADALLDLHEVTHEDRYHEVAREAVAAFAGAHERFGPQAAAFASVAGRLRHGTLRIDVAAPAGTDLHRAALRLADHEAVVVPAVGERSDAGTDPTDYEDGAAYVVTGGEPSPPAHTPASLEERVTAHR